MYQGLCRLWEGVGDAVAEALSKTCPVEGEVAGQGDRGWAGRNRQAAQSSPFLSESHLFWMDLASQPLWPTIWVMFLASHQALLSGNSANLLMGGGAASSMVGRTAPTRTRSIVAFRAWN